MTTQEKLKHPKKKKQFLIKQLIASSIYGKWKIPNKDPFEMKAKLLECKGKYVRFEITLHKKKC